MSRSASSWGCELKSKNWSALWIQILSASSWGCELKCHCCIFLSFRSHVSLFVRLWVEISSQLSQKVSEACQPLREAVSWNVSKNEQFDTSTGQPLREAVSWNNLPKWLNDLVVSSASSWGCELKCARGIIDRCQFRSASSWGCELKWKDRHSMGFNNRQPLREAVSWNICSR